MDLAPLYAADWEVFDDRRIVSYLSRTAAGHAAAVEVPNVLRGPISNDDLMADATLLDHVTTVFHLWRSQMGGVTPKGQDVIQEGVTRWTVYRVVPIDEGERFRCVCVRER